MREQTNLSLLEIILIDYRWVVVIFLIPISFLYNIFYRIRAEIVFRLNSAPDQHKNKVKRIQKQINDWNKSGRKSKLCTARPGWQTMSFRRPKYKKTMCQIDCNLIDIIYVDLERNVVCCQPMVTMGQLSNYLLKNYNMGIPIVPELDDLTVGGLIMGTGVESASHKYGLFNEICKSYEIVLSTGELIKCTADNEYSDLFNAIPWSYGTLGFLVSAEIQIIPVKKYVKLEYESYSGNLSGLVTEFRKASDEEKYDFVEGLLYGPNDGVLMKGMYSTAIDNDARVNPIGKWYKPWFYLHVEKILKKKKNHVEYIPLLDYYHRHTKSLFWEMYEIIPFGNHPLFRILFGWLLPIKVSLLKLTQTNSIKKLYEQNHVIQDLLINQKHLEPAIQYMDDKLHLYPVWLCPFKLNINQPGMLQSKEMDPEGTHQFVDIGLYGIPQIKRKPGADPKAELIETTRTIEAEVRRLKGFQMLYADTFCTKDEFYEMFNHDLYNKCKPKYDANNAFPLVYDKVNHKARD